MGTEPLFTPLQLGAVHMKNRIVMAPLTRSRASNLGVPATFASDYYAQRASAGLLITEATQVSFEGMGYSRTPGLHTPEQIEAWRKIVERVHGAGGKIAVQLWHVGRIAHPLNRGVAADVVAPSAIAAPGTMWTDQSGMQPHPVPRALETSEIARIAGEFATAAERAIEVGFDAVELHSANGYLLHQFLSSNVNKRTDRYGGSIENRVRMPLEVLEAILAKVPSDRVGLRVSPAHAFNGIEEADADALYSHYYTRLSQYQLAYLHVMRPFANASEGDPVAFARPIYKGKLIACGGYTGETAATLVSSGGADAIAFGKDYIANPDLAGRLQSGSALSSPDQSTFYTPGETGYTDYPRVAA